MSKKSELLADRVTYLAEKRTELAEERTLMSFIRTGTTVVLFGIAFFGLSEHNVFLFYSGVIAIILGVILIILAMYNSVMHTADIHHIKVYGKRKKAVRNVRIIFKK